MIIFTPAVYEHAAALIGRRPWEVSRDAELLYAAHAEAFRQYRHAPVVVGIDIYNLEAEAYGARVAEPAGNDIPAIGTHPCDALEEVTALPLYDPAVAERIPMLLDVAHRLQADLPMADVRVPVSGPFSIACALASFDTVLCEMLEAPEVVRAALEHLVDGQLRFCAAARRQGVGITFFESATTPPLLSPALFKAVEFPVLQRFLREASAIMGQPVPCIIGGNTFPILEPILATGTRYVICPAETNQSAFMQAIHSRTEVRVRVNTDIRPFVHGPWEAVRAEIDRVATLVSDRDNTCLGTGALPYEANPEFVIRAREYVRGL